MTKQRTQGAPVKFATTVYILIVLSFTCLIWKYPAYNWDMLAYMAQIRIYAGQRNCTVHDEVYREAARTFPAAKYQNVTASIPQQRVWASDCGAFLEQLPFYSIRPGYIAGAFLLHKFGLSPSRALVLLSVLCWWGLAILLWVWIRRYRPPWQSLVIAAGSLLALLPFARLATPDLMATLMILAALFFAGEQRRVTLALVLSLLALTVRTDAAFFVLAIAAMLAWHRQVRVAWAVLTAAVAVLAVLTINHLTGNYGWVVLMQHSFRGYMVHPAQAAARFSLPEHLELVGYKAVELGFGAGVVILLAMVAALNGSRLSRVFWLVTGVTVVKFILYPSAEPRHLAALISASALAIAGVSQRHGLHSTSLFARDEKITEPQCTDSVLCTQMCSDENCFTHR